MIKRSFDQENKLETALQNTVQNISKGDVFSSVSYSQAVSFENDKLQSIDDTSYSSLGCRIFHKGRVGNSFTNDPLLFTKMIADAKESATLGEEIDFQLPGKSEFRTLEWTNNLNNLSFNKQDLKDIAVELLQKIKQFAPNAKVSSTVYNGFSKFSLSNTSGFQGFYEESVFSLQGGLFEIAPDGSFLEIYEGFTFYDQDMDFSKITEPLRKRVEMSRISVDMSRTGKMPVIFAPSAMDSLLNPIEIAANGKTLYKGLSVFDDKEDKMFFSENFSLTDDPFYYHGAASSPFDDEGFVGQALPIIENGVFRNFILDSAHAKKLNKTNTGHATRNFQILPSPTFSNRIVHSGKHSLEEMITSVDHGVLLLLSLGEGQSNVIAGDFSVLADSAFLISDGIIKGRVKDIMLSGNAFELLKSIPMLENKLHKESSLFAPHILLDNVSVSKK